MLISNLVGGLGNQMFQYSCARALSLELGIPLKFCIDGFDAYKAHNGFELEQVFGLSMEIATEKDIRETIGFFRSKYSFRRLLSKKPFQFVAGRRFINEPGYRYWPGLAERARQGGYLQGYWQSERYFTKHADEIRADFTFKTPLSEKNEQVLAQIQESKAVSLHVRRGDYASNAKTLSVHGVCSLDYYQEAIDCLMQRYDGIRLFIFSDDPQWVKENLNTKSQEMVIVDHNKGAESYNDMRLMSLCDHHIIANSSFSWWGAWLNPKQDKTVIAPMQWFANGTDTQDLIPTGWERL